MSFKLKVMLFVTEVYRRIFGRKIFIKFNKFLYHLSLHGMGILNYENFRISGEENFLKKITKEKDVKVIFDIGANKGLYSIKTMESNPNVTLYAFEPNDKTFEQLLQNANKYKFRAFNFGVGERNEIADIYDYKEKDGSSHASLYKDVLEKLHNSESIAHKIRIVTIDSFAKNNNIDRINLLKIDTEGNELKVLQGSSNLIKNNKIDIIHFEFNEMNVYSRVFFRDFYEILENYNFFRMILDGLIFLDRYNPIYNEIFAYQNIVAVRKDLKIDIFKTMR